MPSTDSPLPAEPRFGRRRPTPRRVLFVDRFADRIIRAGGVLVILAIFGIMVFLIAEVLPLFRGGEVLSATEYRIVDGKDGHLLAVDEHDGLAVRVNRRGQFSGFHVGTGTPVPVEAPAGENISVRSVTVAADGRNFALGTEDGRIILGEVVFRTTILPRERLPQELIPLDRRDRLAGTRLYSELASGEWRRTQAVVRLAEPLVASPDGKAILKLALRLSGTPERREQNLLSLDAAGVLRLVRARARLNLADGRLEVVPAMAEIAEVSDPASVAEILVTARGDQALLLRRQGVVERFLVRDLDQIRRVEERRLLAEGAELTAVRYLLGDQTLLVAGSDGSLTGWFLLERQDAGTGDGRTLVAARRFAEAGDAIVLITPGQRSKSFLVADASGRIALWHSTSERRLLDFSPLSSPVHSLVFAPREDAVLAIAEDGQARHWRIAVPHPETSLHTLFGRVWYEGFAEPAYVWQSSAGSDDFEPKLSLVPLIFGTLKGTIYALLFAVPIALAAAIYTSEFLSPRARNVVKPAIETMAALPSVVLGFVAALVISPWVENFVLAVLLAFLAVPIGLLTGGFIWQALPCRRWRAARLLRPLLFAIVLMLSLASAMWLAPRFEALFFAGDFRAWLAGSGEGDRALLTGLLLPLALIGSWWGVARLMPTRWRETGRGQFVFFLTVLATSAFLAFTASTVLTWLGAEARGGVFGPYTQRNTLVVAFAMGFAVIPLIYTIAEDALSAVPEHLRAASLALGATPWQTAMRVILPTAFSGIFAAVMIGMGRAVGETMIVVMAAGNTPVIDWNLFNGFRALSANIAVELPEAVRGGTLYRVLFLAGLVLFVLTFALNTLAEIIRLRFRRRAAQL